MKKTLVAAILGIGLTSAVFGQSKIRLYNYLPSASVPNPITYGAGSGGTLGQPVASATPFTVGFYYVVGSQAVAVNGLMTGSNESATIWGGALTLATGQDATADRKSVV